jgi:hypothetical protein
VNTTDDIIAAAEKRLAELDAEATKLRRMIAAAKGEVLAPTVNQPPYMPIPMPFPVPGVPMIEPWKPIGWQFMPEVWCGTT